MAKEIQNKEKWVWKRAGAYQVLELAKQGKSVSEIADVVKWREDTVWNFISSSSFLRRLEAYLQSVFFNFQKNKILALEEVFQFLWQVALGRKMIEGLTQDQAMGHLVKIFHLKEKEPKVINPKQYNIIMNVFKTEPERPRNLAEEFGFAGLLPEGGDSETEVR